MEVEVGRRVPGAPDRGHLGPQRDRGAGLEVLYSDEGGGCHCYCSADIENASVGERHSVGGRLTATLEHERSLNGSIPTAPGPRQVLVPLSRPTNFARLWAPAWMMNWTWADGSQEGRERRAGGYIAPSVLPKQYQPYSPIVTKHCIHSPLPCTLSDPRAPVTHYSNPNRPPTTYPKTASRNPKQTDTLSAQSLPARLLTSPQTSSASPADRHQLARQVRVRGPVERLASPDSDEYFASRDRASSRNSLVVR